MRMKAFAESGEEWNGKPVSNTIASISDLIFLTNTLERFTTVDFGEGDAKGRNNGNDRPTSTSAQFRLHRYLIPRKSRYIGEVDS